jgi:transcriptional regulator with XRE-family HTH domain
LRVEEPQPPQDEEHIASLKGMGEAITILRERHGLSRDEVAPKAEMTVEELEALERGEVHERWGGLRKVAYGIGVPLAELLTTAEESAPGSGGEAWRRKTGEAKSSARDAQSDTARGRGRE